MMNLKHSFYPTDALEAHLREDAKQTRRTIGKVVCDILDAYYAQLDQQTEPKPDEVHKGVCELLLDAGLSYLDNRSKGGCLWVIDQPGAREQILKIEKLLNCKFVLAADGSKATNGKAAWYMTRG